jgi:hypothetical protein
MAYVSTTQIVIYEYNNGDRRNISKVKDEVPVLKNLSAMP